MQENLLELAKRFEEVSNKLLSGYHLFSRRSIISKVLVITLGALVATREAFSQVLGVTNPVLILTFVLFGVAIATATGLETSFKWENKAVQLRLLATECDIAAQDYGFQLRNLLSSSPNWQQDRRDDANNLFNKNEALLSNIQQRAAEFGVLPEKFNSSSFLALIPDEQGLKV